MIKFSEHDAVTGSHTVTAGYCLCCWGVVYCADVMYHHFPSEHEYLVLQHNRIEMDYLSQFKCFFLLLLFSGDLKRSLSCFNFCESFGAFVSSGRVRCSRTSFMIIYLIFSVNVLQKEKYCFMKTSHSPGAAHKLRFPCFQGFRPILVPFMGASKTALGNL